MITSLVIKQYKTLGLLLEYSSLGHFFSFSSKKKEKKAQMRGEQV